MKGWAEWRREVVWGGVEFHNGFVDTVVEEMGNINGVLAGSRAVE